MTTDQQRPDEVLDPNDPDAGREAADMATSTDVAADLHQPSALAHRNPYDVAVPETLRERLAYARMLAAAGILPRDYAAKPANILVAGEMGRELGLSTIQSVMLLSVVEGKPSLGANGVRAVVQRAGHMISGAQIEYNRHGVPTSATVKGERADTGQALEVTWTLQRAARAGLCSLRYDDDGEPYEVRARSQYDKVLPWEAYTEDMLDARATVKLGRALFGDVTLGLSYEREELQEGPGLIADAGTKVTAAPAEPSARAQAVLQQVRPTRRTDLPDDYAPADDLAMFPDGDWWVAAGAQVSRRNAAQLAADRIAKWVADHPDQDTVPLPPLATDEARPADDGPVAEPGTDAAYCSECGHPDDDCQCDPLPDDPEPDEGEQASAADEQPDEELPDDVPGDDGPALDEEPDDAAPDLGDDMAPTVAELLAEVDAAAEQIGKSRQAIMVRWIASHRKNPEDATAEELLPFVEQLRTTMAQRQG